MAFSSNSVVRGVAFLAKSVFQRTTSAGAALLKAAAANDSRACHAAIESGAQVDVREAGGATPLIVACGAGALDAVL